MAFPFRSIRATDVLGELQRCSPAATIAVLKADTAAGVLTSRYLTGAAASRLEDICIDIGYHVSGWVAAHCVPMVNADAQLDLDGRAGELRYVLAMPVLSGSHLVGVLAFYNSTAFGEAILHRIETLMPQVAAWLEADEEPATATGTHMGLMHVGY
jgi:GAF domain-containing protein